MAAKGEILDGIKPGADLMLDEYTYDYYIGWDCGEER